MSLREMLRSSRLLRPVEDLQAPIPVEQLPVQLGRSVEAQVERRDRELFWWGDFCRLELCWKMIGGQGEWGPLEGPLVRRMPPACCLLFFVVALICFVSAFVFAWRQAWIKRKEQNAC